MKSFKQYLTESVSTIPSDLKSLIDKYVGMNNFTKAIYDACHKDLNDLEVGGDIKTGNRISTSDIEKINKDGNYIVIELAATEELILAGYRLWGRVYDSRKKSHDSIYLDGRNLNVDSARNIASIMNSDKYKDCRYWLIDLSNAKSTEDLRKERYEAQQGVVQRYNDGWYTRDKSGYRVDSNKYVRMLQELKMKGNEYIDQLADISAEFYKVLAKIEDKSTLYEVGDICELIKSATNDTTNQYAKPSEIKAKLEKARQKIKELEARRVK